MFNSVPGTQGTPSAPGGSSAAAPPPAKTFLAPPNLHWLLVGFLGLICGAIALPSDLLQAMPPLLLLNSWMFGTFWLLVQSGFISKVSGNSHPLLLARLGAGLFSVGLATIWAVQIWENAHDRSWDRGYGISSPPEWLGPVGALLLIFSIVLYILGCFRLREAMEEHYSEAEPIGLALNGWMTFVFGATYLQYHFCRIARLKGAGLVQSR